MNHGLKLHPDGTLEITMPKDRKITRVLVCEAGTQNAKLFYPESYYEECRQLAEWMKELKAKRKQVEILARCLDGCPLTIPCDKMIVLGVWCERHCKERDLTCPDYECWLRYAEVIANERFD